MQLAENVLETVVALIGQYPIPAALLVLVLVGVAASRRAGVEKDVQRAFSASQRAEISRRAGGRCEYTGMLGLRCSRAGAHADHVYPHSKGGPTTVANGAWACAPHNLSKGARWPSRWMLWNLHRRRRRYFPDGTELRVMRHG